MKIAFCSSGITTDSKVWFAFSLMLTRWPKGAQVFLVAEFGRPIRNAMHKLFERALTIEPDWIIYTGVDVGWEPDAIATLIAHDKDIIGGWSNGRMPPFYCHVCDAANETYDSFRVVKNAPERHGIEKVCTVGQELTVYRPSIFKKIAHPWFYGNDMISAGGTQMTEDYYFCRKAHLAGVEVWVDWDVLLDHATDGLVTKGGKVVQYVQG